MGNSGKRKTLRSTDRGVLHVDRPLTSEAPNALLFPFYCTKSVLLSILLIGLPYVLIFTGSTTLKLIGTILFFISIPLFLGFATYSATRDELPEYPPLMELVGLSLRTLATIILNSLLFILGGIIISATKTTNVLLLGLWLLVGALTLYLMPKSLILLSGRQTVMSSVLNLRPAFNRTYLMRALVNIVVGGILLLIISILGMIPLVGLVLLFIGIAVAVYYWVVFSLSFLAESVE